MDQTITLQALVQLGAVIVALWGAYKVIMEVVKAINDRHDREKKWDETAREIQEERVKIVERYDKRLAEIEERIEENHCDTEAKIQELKADMFILTKSLSATLDGLKQLGANGAVTEAKKDLDSFLMGKAYD